MLNLKNLLFNSLIGYAGSFLMIGIGIITKMVLARLLPPSEYGLLMTGQIILSLGVFLASLGLADAIIRYVGLFTINDPGMAKGVLRTGLGITLKSGIAVAALLILLAPIIANQGYHATALAGVLTIFACSIPFKVRSDMYAAAHQGQGRFWVKTVFADIAPAVFLFTLLFIFYALNAGTLNRVAIIFFCSAGFTLLSFRVINRSAPFQDYESKPFAARKLIHYSVPLLGAGIVAWPLAMVPLFIGSVISAEQVAYYTISISLASFIYLGVSVAEASGFPVWASYHHAGRLDILLEDYRFVSRWCFLLGAIIFTPLFLCSPEVMSFLFGNRYIPAAHILQALSLIYLINLLSGPNESILKALGFTKWIFITRLAVGAVVLVSLYPFLHYWSVGGAIAVYWLSTLTGIIMYAGFLLLKCRIHPMNMLFAGWIFAASVAFLIVHAIHDSLSPLLSDILSIIIITGSYFITLVCLLSIFRLFTERDIRIIRHFFNNPFTIKKRS